MRWRREKHRPQPAPKPDTNAGFAWREIICASEEAAKAEAERQQASEPDPEAEWIYLRPESTGRWVARRTPRHPDVKMRGWNPLVGFAAGGGA